MPEQSGGNGRPRPLSGVRIIDFGQIIAMPLAGEWLAFFGAEVILVESRVNLPSGGYPPFAGEPPYNTSGYFNYINRNKRSCTLNLRKPDGVELAKRLVATADAVQHNSSPGTMERLGLGYETLRTVRPDIVMLSLSACGNTGPWRHRSALHSGVILLSGFANVTGYPGDYPRLLGSFLPDPLAGAYCVLALTQAIYQRRQTGQGRDIDLAMTETLQSLMPDAVAEYTMLGREPHRIGNRHAWKAPHGIYRTRGEDTWLAISVSSEEEWQALCQAIGHPTLASDHRFATFQLRNANADALDSLITRWTLEQDSQEATRLLQEAAVPASPTNNMRDLLADEHLRGRGFVVEDDHPQAGRRVMPGVPWRFKSLGPPDYRHAPLLGEDNDYVFGEILGLETREIQQLIEDQVIY